MKKDRQGWANRNPEDWPGIRKKSFVLPFAGGEIWFEHLDGMGSYTELAVQKLRADAVEFRRPSAPGFIAFVLDETVVTEALTAEIAGALLRPGKRFMRAAFVGADGLSRKMLKKRLDGHGFAIRFFDGIEPAKEWLLGKEKN